MALVGVTIAKINSLDMGVHTVISSIANRKPDYRLEPHCIFDTKRDVPLPCTKDTGRETRINRDWRVGKIF